MVDSDSENEMGTLSLRGHSLLTRSFTFTIRTTCAGLAVAVAHVSGGCRGFATKVPLMRWQESLIIGNPKRDPAAW